MFTLITLEELSKDKNFNDARHPLIHVDFHVADDSSVDRIQSDAYERLLVKVYENWSNPFQYKVMKVEWESNQPNVKSFKLIAIRVDEPIPEQTLRSLEELNL